MTAPIAIIMGSQSDWETMRHAADTLAALGVACEKHIVSAHRTPDRLFAFARGAKAAGFKIHPGDIGENITTSGIDLLGLPTGAVLRIGATAVLRITGLRNPCVQLDRFQQGLTAAVLDRDAAGRVVRKAGVMSVVLEGGEVVPGDRIAVELPQEPHLPLVPV